MPAFQSSPSSLVPNMLVLLAGVLLLAVILRLVAGALDHERIRKEIGRRGGRVTGIHWSPFGKGWLAESVARIYDVHYTNASGQARRAWVKTSMLAGVYFADDQPEGAAGSDPAGNDLAREVERLRAENAALRDKVRDG